MLLFVDDYGPAMAIVQHGSNSQRTNNNNNNNKKKNSLNETNLF